MRKYISKFSEDSILVEASPLKLESGETPYKNLKGDSQKLDRVALSAKRIIGCMASDLVVCDASSPNFHKFTENFDGHTLKVVGVTDEESEYKTLVFAGTINRVPVIRLVMDEEGSGDGEHIHYDYFIFKNIDKAQMLGIRRNESFSFRKDDAVESINASMSKFFSLDPTAERFRVDTIRSGLYDPMEDSLLVEAVVSYDDEKLGSKERSLKLKNLHSGKYRVEGFCPTEGNILMEGDSIIFKSVEMKGMEEDMRKYQDVPENTRHYEFDEKVLAEQLNQTLSSIFSEEQFHKFLPFSVKEFTEAYFSAKDDSLILESDIVYEDGESGNATFRLSDIHTGKYTLTETTGAFDIDGVTIEGECSVKDDAVIFGEES